MKKISYDYYTHYFESEQDAIKYKSQTHQRTNDRYSGFNQMYFTAGDKNQFNLHSKSKQNIGIKLVKARDGNKFVKYGIPQELEWPSYRNIKSSAILNTFNHMFDKYKKGIYVSIRNNKVDVFLPFSNVNYRNRWSENAKFSIQDAINCVSKSYNGKNKFNPKSVNRNIDQWYCNNNLVRFEYPIRENDSGIQQIIDMFTELCNQRDIPDIDFFVNKRDFPLLRFDQTESYSGIFGEGNINDTRHLYDSYCPILSMTTTMNHADIPIPTWEDWTRSESINSGKFYLKPIRDYRYTFNHDWNTKKDTAIFRGASTGCGVTIETNQRLRLCNISHQYDDKDFIDAGITSWNLRPRLIRTKTSKLLINTIDTESLPFGLSESLSPEQQSNYRYIINVDGHATAYRLSLELSMRSVIMLVDSEYYIWYMKYLEPWVHYIPIKKDMSDLIDKIKWAKTHDEECRKIAENSLLFYETYLSRDSIFDYLQSLLINISVISGQPYMSYVENRAIDIKSYQKTNLHTLPVKLSLPSKLSLPCYYTISRILNTLSDTFNHQNSKKYLEYLDTNLFTSSRELFTTKSNIVSSHSISDHKDIILSKTIVCDSYEKIKEAKHSYNVGLVINKLCNFTRNFMLTLSIYDAADHSDAVIFLKNVKGILFSDWLKSKEFNFPDFYLIIIQLSFSLSTAFHHYGFIHNDMYPWNIIIKTYKSPQIVQYNYYGKLVSIQTHIIPVIIDYGKANIIINDNYYRFNEKSIEIQDILTIIVSSSYQIINNHHIDKKNIILFLKFCNFISSSQYTNYKKFITLSSVKQFTYMAKKYDEIINSSKGELSTISINKFINFMLSNYLDNISGTIYFTKESNIIPNVNLDNIIYRDIDQDNDPDNDPDIDPVQSIIIRMKKYIKNNTSQSPKINYLQCLKYYQNLWNTFEYFKNFVENYSIDNNINSQYIEEFEKLHNISKEKLVLDFQSYKKTNKSLPKINDIDFTPLSKTIDSSIDLLNIDKLISLVVDFNFNNYKLIHRNKLLINTFEDIQYFSGPQELQLSRSEEKYYIKYTYDKEMNNISNLIKNKTSNIPNDITTQYIDSIYDKTILRQLKHSIQQYELELELSKSKDKIDMSRSSKDYSLDDKIIETGNSVFRYISSLDIL